MRFIGTIISIGLIIALGVFIYKNVKAIIFSIKKRKEQKLNKKE